MRLMVNFFMPSGFQRGTHPAKIPVKARRRSEDWNIDVESGSENNTGPNGLSGLGIKPMVGR